MLDVLFDRDGGRAVFSVTCRVDDKAVRTPMFSRNQTTFGAALQQAIVGLVPPQVLRHLTPKCLASGTCEERWLCCCARQVRIER